MRRPAGIPIPRRSDESGVTPSLRRHAVAMRKKPIKYSNRLARVWKQCQRLDQCREETLPTIVADCAAKCNKVNQGSKLRSNATRMLKMATTVLATAGFIFAIFSRFPCLYLCPFPYSADYRYGKVAAIPVRTYQELVAYVDTVIRDNMKYVPIQPEPYDIFDCPMEPPSDYPHDYPIMKVLEHWPIQDTDKPADRMRMLHQGICVFDFAKHGGVKVLQQMRAYQQAEKPFVVRNDPRVLHTVERWNTKNYLHHKLYRKVYHGEFSESLSMMYWKVSPSHLVPTEFVPPTVLRPTTFEKWFQRANEMETSNSHQGDDPATSSLTGTGENAYLRLDGCLNATAPCDAAYRSWGSSGMGLHYYTHLDNADFLHDELPFFSPRYYRDGISKDYLIEPEKSRGIQCRFGAKGLVAEDHFDNSRNFIAVLGGERRYLIGRPDKQNCQNMYLYPMRHPSERHSQVDWNDPDLTKYPNFRDVRVNEVVLQAGDVLYLPTYWFHHIISLGLNYQCNARSGHSLDYDQDIYDCGFLYPWAD